MTDPNQPHLPPPTSPIPEGIAPPALPPTEGTGFVGGAEPVPPAPAAASPVPPASPERTAPDAAATSQRTPAPGFDERGRVRATKVSGVWVGLIGTALFLILLVIFIAQNSRRVSLHFFGWHGQFSLALTILISAVIGVLLVAIPGTVRIVQLRHALRRNGPRA
ncbi:MAG TPA: lipopolysaccharide assembly protein LapA domain-containing protein [Jatrophihabitans sp.]|nr:lipopolysaccharide assembly protein LapA domain-containing protein [Jatrophihabitans sp.]